MRRPYRRRCDPLHALLEVTFSSREIGSYDASRESEATFFIVAQCSVLASGSPSLHVSALFLSSLSYPPCGGIGPWRFVTSCGSLEDMHQCHSVEMKVSKAYFNYLSDSPVNPVTNRNKVLTEICMPLRRRRTRWRVDPWGGIPLSETIQGAHTHYLSFQGMEWLRR